MLWDRHGLIRHVNKAMLVMAHSHLMSKSVMSLKGSCVF